MARGDASESQNKTFTGGIKGGGVGKALAIRGKKIDTSVVVIGDDADMTSSGIKVGVGVSISVGIVIV